MVARTFGEALSEFRVRALLTQEGLAGRSEVAVRTIRRYESGERANPQASTVKQLADALPLSEAERKAFFALATGQKPEQVRVPMQSTRQDQAADELATHVRIRLRREYEHEQVHDPFPLPVRWEHVFGELSDHAENIDAQPLDGGFGEIAAVYRRVPTGRLVVLGAAGSGKTVLATRLTLDLLRDREPGRPVPVLVGIAMWDPRRIEFRAWLSELLVRDYPDLAATATGSLTLAAELVGTDLILPVLDGFDEMAASLRGLALQQLSRTDLPLVLTSRPAEYENAVTADVLTRAAVIRLDVLTPADLAEYLPRATPSGLAAARWRPVLAKLDTSDIVAAALRTPLMVSLARSIYRDTSGRDPAELLDTGQFPAISDVEEHLLGSYLPSRYDEPGGRWRLDQVRRWLGHLARHGEPGIAWWGLGTSLWSQAVVVALVSTLAITVIYIVVGAPLTVLLYGVTYPEGLRRQLSGGLFNGAVAGPVLGVAHGLIRHFRLIAPSPSRLRPRLGRAGAIPLAQVRSRVVTAFVGGSGFGAAGGLLTALSGTTTLRAGVVLGAVFAVVFGTAAAAAIGTLAWFEAPADADAAASPGDSLKANRESALTQMVLGGLVFGLTAGLGSYVFGDVIIDFAGSGRYTALNYALGVGAINWITGSLVYLVTVSAWGHWLIIARLWLPLTGRLPWRLRTFLDDAYDRGVLRQSGPVWEFRHERLQRHLAEPVRGRADPAPHAVTSGRTRG
ncbi:helix-turn-helix domain-containing protein [Lentzea sp. NBC_00516]|uniref:NACHT domain-containing protein n=1 Tax=Lentzea sp. NBC_00516 TaxID=2903582 RepID=UPI002E815F37|nr:helix-turn-helix domain-containing protein [Lentzea sp. NBC_00516]WUD27092.1 helix-turn-helix domain-containing protein [Lentzea sp. NBC_00516]